MNNILETMIKKFNPKNQVERENAIKEVLQEITLSALSKSDFFSKVGFYGGTCARIFYGLNRFSEDLDFATINESIKINIINYFPYLEKEFKSYGIKIELSSKDKLNDIETAFIKTNTQSMFLLFYPDNQDSRDILSNKNIKIKIEVDLNNPEGWIVSSKYRLLPTPYQISVFDESTLFSGKIHALLCRKYSNRVKGRDYYDYLYYVSKNTKLNLPYLQNKLINSGISKVKLNLNDIKKMLLDKFNTTNYKQAIDDVIKFIDNEETTNNWSKELFVSTLSSLK